MTAFEGASRHDDPGLAPELDPQRLARMGQPTGWWEACPPRRRRRRIGQLYLDAFAGALVIAAVTFIALVAL